MPKGVYKRKKRRKKKKVVAAAHVRRVSTVDAGQAAQLRYLKRHQQRLEIELDQVRRALGMAIVRLYDDGTGYAAVGRVLGLHRVRVGNIAKAARKRDRDAKLAEAANLRDPMDPADGTAPSHRDW